MSFRGGQMDDVAATAPLKTPLERNAEDLALVRQVRRKAIRCVVLQARDVPEAHELLNMLGLDPHEVYADDADVRLPVTRIGPGTAFNDPTLSPRKWGPTKTDLRNKK